MKKTYKLEGLGCVNCAEKMSHSIAKLDGVQSAHIGFFTGKLKLELDDAFQDEAALLKLTTQIQNIITSYEENCRLVLN